MMAADNPIAPKPVQPSANGRGRPRQNSGRKSYVKPTPLPASIESPRTLCPRDRDDFSFSKTHLPRWYVGQDLWDRLPQSVQSALTEMQQAGAAVLTGYERLEQHSGAMDMGRGPSSPDDELLVQLDDSIHSLDSLPPMFRTESSFSSSAVLSAPSSGSGSPTSMSASQTMSLSSMSPICLTPVDAMSTGTRPRERSFSTPLEPHNAYYVTELSQLRTESLPRLRHRARTVDTAWYEAKRSNTLSPNDVKEFENWWADKKCAIENLYEKGKRLSDAVGLSPNGMGWTAP